MSKWPPCGPLLQPGVSSKRIRKLGALTKNMEGREMCKKPEEQKQTEKDSKTVE